MPTINHSYSYNGTSTRIVKSNSVALPPPYAKTEVGVQRFGGFSRTWVRTPGFRNLKPSDLPVNPFYFERGSKQYCTGVGSFIAEYFSPSSTWEEYYYVNGPAVGPTLPGNNHPTYTSGELSDADNVAITKLLLRLKDQKVNLGQVVGESKQTRRLFVTTVRRLASTALLLKRGSLGLAARALGVRDVPKSDLSRYSRNFRKDPSRSVASGWLELQYGWLPLLSDLYGICDVVFNGAVNVRRSRVVATIKRKDDLDGSYGALFSDAPELLSQFRLSRRLDIKYVVYYTVQAETSQSLSALGITNPTMVAWELLPWSFVVDWALPIGNWINTWDSTLGLSFKSGSKTVVQELKRDEFARGYQRVINAESDRQFQADMKAFDHKFICQRSVLSTFPQAGFPTVKHPFSSNGSNRIANAMALLVTSFKR